MAQQRNNDNINALRTQMELRERLLQIQLEEEQSMSRQLQKSKEIIRGELEKQKAVENIADINLLLRKYKEGEIDLNDEELRDLSKILAQEKARVVIADKSLKISKQRVTVLKTMSSLYDRIGSSSFWTFLMQSDEAIKNVNRELGFVGQRSETFRENIYEAANDAARLGGNLQDLTNIVSIFADETGRAKVLSADALENIMEIGLGTGLGVDQAARLAGQFELMGLNAKSTVDYVQNILDSTERMGVNTTKVLKNISANFNELQKFTFRNGVRGFAQMAAHAEKFRIDMGSMLDSAERARTLEGAVELAAQLQVMGGEFAKTDPFELLFLSRNDPAAYAKRINDMTKSVATFRRNADGTFETFISPMDIDRLERVGEALGMQRGELTQQARRMAEIQRMRQQMLGTNFSQEQKEAIEGAAQFNSETGQFFVQVAGAKKDLSRLTQEDARLLQQQSKLLNERAMDAKTFDKVFQDTVLEFKSNLLPVLDGINQLLKQYITPSIQWLRETFDSAPEWTKDLMKSGGMLLAGGVAIGGVAKIIGSILSPFKGIMNILPKISKGKGGASKLAKGGIGTRGGFATGAGIGVAGLGIGAGIGIASEGISNLADSLSKLDKDQAETLSNIVQSLTILTGIASLAAIGVMAFGAGAATAAPGLLAFGGAVALVGAGIGLATAGIGYMSENLTNLLTNADPKKLFTMAGGVTALATASSLFANPLSLVGLAGISSNISTISKTGPGMEKVGNAFEKISVVLQGSMSQLDAVKETIQAISNTELGNKSAISTLNSILSKPLKVQFADNNPTFNASINLNIDGRRFAETINLSRRVAIQTVDEKNGKSSAGMV